MRSCALLRHACGFKLANDGHDTRALQHSLGHKNIQHTVRPGVVALRVSLKNATQ
jgi:site-specific recombinase XerD